MNVRTLIVGTLAIVSGLSAMILVQALRKGPPVQQIEKGQVVISTADVKVGEVVQEGMIEIREIPKTDIPEDAIVQAADAIDRAAMTPIDKGDVLRQKKLSDKGSRGINVGIKEGMRAFTITTPSFSSSLAGFILPHNRVDVLLTVNVQGSNENEAGGTVTTTLLQNVEVMAVHSAINTPTANKFTPEEARSVTLQVTPEEAKLLDLGQNKGTLHLTLRNIRDTMIVDSKPVGLEQLKIPGLVKKPAPVVEKPAEVVPPPAFVVEEPEPEPIEVKLTVRTLRGTSAGQDTLTMVQKPAPKRRRLVPAPPAPASASSEPKVPVGPLAKTDLNTAPGAPPIVAGAGSSH